MPLRTICLTILFFVSIFFACNDSGSISLKNDHIATAKMSACLSSKKKQASGNVFSVLTENGLQGLQFTAVALCTADYTVTYEIMGAENDTITISMSNSGNIESYCFCEKNIILYFRELDVSKIRCLILGSTCYRKEE